ncbi:hypothetical protein E2C01_006208 [Portunus trituberculatus]|uniref:Uncharacterized protein n=1 Tax=Portunus trituberculatus TaxID=210409 RepID=A0A5B7CUM0_PORTR|nr:hypothetical protein [Portunus trituberculatus]
MQERGTERQKRREEWSKTLSNCEHLENHWCMERLEEEEEEEGQMKKGHSFKGEHCQGQKMSHENLGDDGKHVMGSVKGGGQDIMGNVLGDGSVMADEESRVMEV